MRWILPVWCSHMMNKNVHITRNPRGSSLCECYPYFDKGTMDPSSHSQSDSPCLSPCRPCNSLLLCLCWKVKGGSCCDMKGLHVSTPPLWFLHQTLQLMTLWECLRLTAPTFFTFQLWQEKTFSSNLHTVQPQDTCLRPYPHKAKAKSESTKSEN